MKLHIKGKVISIHSKMDVLDEQENVVYKVASKALSIHDKTYIKDAAGNDVAYIHAKVISIHQVHYVEMANGMNFEIRLKLGHPIHNVIDIPELGWQIQGEFMAHDYKIVDSNEKVLATAHRKWLSVHGIYSLDIIEDDKADILLSAYIVLEHILSSQEAATTTSSLGTTINPN